jgi:hypothetical protein
LMIEDAVVTRSVVVRKKPAMGRPKFACCG